VLAVRNEERHLRTTVSHVLAQRYPGELELVIAVGVSTDRTAQIAQQIAATDPRVRLVHNPAGTTPSGLNAAIRHARHDIIVRVDARGLLAPDYVRLAVEILDETGADNVGGVLVAQGETPLEQAIALAMTSWIGIGSGGGRFDPNGRPGPVDTVYLGVFRRAVLDRLGGYDENLVRTQDWELNYRIRREGGIVWCDPRLRVTYRPRPNLASMAAQFYSNGRWRRAVGRLHPGTLHFRYLAPPLTTIGCLAGMLLGLVGLAVPPLMVAWSVPAAYLVAIVIGSTIAGRDLPWRAWVWLPLVLVAMHLTWGTGFLTSPSSLGRSAPTRAAVPPDVDEAAARADVHDRR
jgi:GT2 family glycosyltransferase